MRNPNERPRGVSDEKWAVGQARGALLAGNIHALLELSPEERGELFRELLRGMTVQERRQAERNARKNLRRVNERLRQFEKWNRTQESA